MSISASALLGMGLNFTVGYGQADNAVNIPGISDQTNIHGKVGYIFGENIAVAIRYMTGSDILNNVANNIDSESIGIAAQWTANDWLDVYGGIESSSIEQTTGGGTSEDLVVGTVGLKVSF
jgi:hypothetical protein